MTDLKNQTAEEEVVLDDAIKKILVVDDILYVVKSISKIFQDEGHFVISAVSGSEALEKIFKYSPHLITVDHNLKDMTGLDLIRKVKKINPNIKILYLSAVHDRKVIKTVLGSGVQHYLIKPFKKNRLLELMKEFL